MAARIGFATTPRNGWSSMGNASLRVRSSAAQEGTGKCSCLALVSQPSSFPVIQPGTNLVCIDQLSSLRRCVALLDSFPDFAAVLGQPGLLLVEQRNRVLHKLIHGLVRPTLYVLLDKLFQLRSQMNLHDHILPHPLFAFKLSTFNFQPLPS